MTFACWIEGLLSATYYSEDDSVVAKPSRDVLLEEVRGYQVLTFQISGLIMQDKDAEQAAMSR